MKKAVLIFLFLGLLGFNCFGNEGVPKAISPGITGGVGVVEGRCPTFSWSGVAWAQKYRVVVFGVEDAVTQTAGEIKLSAKPLLSEDIAGGFSWTPSASQGLAEGADYSWYVGAMDAGGAWAWSEARRFRVEASAKLTLSAGERNDVKQQVNKNEAKSEAMPTSAADSAAGIAVSKKGNENGPAYGTEGTWSTFYGYNAGTNNSADTNNNSFFGSYAGYANTTGQRNVFLGQNAGGTSNAMDNTFVGYWSGVNNTSGSGNTFIGSSVGRSNTDGFENTFMGNSAGYNNTDGYWNVFIGHETGNANTEGFSNTFIGRFAGHKNTEGYSNTYLGKSAGENNTTGELNTFIGFESGFANTIGIDNTFLGTSAGGNNTTGNENTFLGFDAGWVNTTGIQNTSIGCFAGYSNSTGNNNVFLGYSAGYNETGSNKLYIDNSDTSTPLIYGDFSTDKVGINGWLGVGTATPAYPMELKTTGRAATFVASRSGGASNFINATDTYGQFGTVNNYAVRILVNSSWRLTLNADNSMNMVSGARCTAGGVWTNASSIALKENIASLSSERAATALRKLNPVTYNYKADKAEQYVGFIAEEVPELVAMNDRQALSPMDIVAVLTKVVQEQQKALLEQKSFIEKQQKIVQEQQKDISALKIEVSEIKKKSENN